MGMYDTFFGEFKCYRCGKESSFEEQTKVFDCLLHDFRLGDLVDYDTNCDWQKKFVCRCDNCNAPNRIMIMVEKGRFSKVVNLDSLNSLKDVKNDLKEKLIEFGKAKGRLEVLKLLDEVLREI